MEPPPKPPPLQGGGTRGGLIRQSGAKGVPRLEGEPVAAVEARRQGLGLPADAEGVDLAAPVGDPAEQPVVGAQEPIPAGRYQESSAVVPDPGVHHTQSVTRATPVMAGGVTGGIGQDEPGSPMNHDPGVRPQSARRDRRGIAVKSWPMRPRGVGYRFELALPSGTATGPDLVLSAGCLGSISRHSV